MTLKFIGTLDERFARLDGHGARCDGNGRRCPRAAIRVFDLRPASKGVAIPGADRIRRQACSKHARTFTDSEQYIVVGERMRSNERLPGRDHPHTVY